MPEPDAPTTSGPLPVIEPVSVSVCPPSALTLLVVPVSAMERAEEKVTFVARPAFPFSVTEPLAAPRLLSPVR